LLGMLYQEKSGNPAGHIKKNWSVFAVRVNSALNSIVLFDEQQPSWFGNSSAFDNLLNAGAVDSDPQNQILPTDDLPSLFAKQVSRKFSADNRKSKMSLIKKQKFKSETLKSIL
jgi:hypothetical protein